MGFFASILSKALGIAKLVLRVVCAPTSFLFHFLARQNARPISQVAFNLAASRAAEAQREDALFVDPLAEYFAAGSNPRRQRRHSFEERSSVSSDAPRRSVSYTITRTKYFDDALSLLLRSSTRCTNAVFGDVMEALNYVASTCQQVVCVGAGFDSRPWRLSAETTRWFEIDVPEVIAEKRRILTSANASLSNKTNSASEYPLTCYSLELIPTNVRRSSWLRRVEHAGLKSTVPTVWLMEGLLVYIEACHVERILKQMSRASPPGSFLLASLVSASTVENTTGTLKGKWRWGCPENAEEFFEEQGWTIVTMLPWTIVAKMYGCKPRKRSFAKEQAQFLVAVKASH